MSIGYSTVAVVQTRWGQALDPSAFPPENIIPFSKVRIIHNDSVYLERPEAPLQSSFCFDYDLRYRHNSDEYLSFTSSANPIVTFTDIHSQIQYAGGPLYTLALLGFKLSLLFSYLRFIGHQRTYRNMIYSVIALCAVNQFIFTLVICLACHPVAKQWDATLPGHCINQVSSYYGEQLLLLF